MKPTFNQFAASILAALSIISIVLIIFIPSQVDKEIKNTGLTALTGCLSASIIFLMKANSDASHAAQMEQMTKALAESTPPPVTPVMQPNRPENINTLTPVTFDKETGEPIKAQSVPENKNSIL